MPARPVTVPARRASSPPERATLVRAAEAAAATWDGARALRVEVPAADADALAWLAGQRVPERRYWHGREETERRAAAGVALRADADRMDGLDGIADLLDVLPAGGRASLTARFDPAGAVADEWAAFGRVRAVLPRVEFVACEGRPARLALHVAPGESVADALRDASDLRPPADLGRDLPAVLTRDDAPGRAGWDVALGEALAAFERGRLAKVVLARRARFDLDGPLDPFALLARLEAASPRAFHALVMPEATGPAFLSATPERLVRLDGQRLRTEAVAGTRPRAEADADDDRLLGELLGSAKDLREHAVVRDDIARRLATLSTSLDIDGRASAMTLTRGRHLYTGIRATLRPEVGPLDVLRALHPTPAVGGAPRAAARSAIARLEPFDRGLYAGLVGWVGRDARGESTAEVAVGIRSGLVDGRRLALYSGAGIVPGSVAAGEWAEIEHKLSDFARVLGLDRLGRDRSRTATFAA